jgi:hypothetical protein
MTTLKVDRRRFIWPTLGEEPARPNPVDKDAFVGAGRP